MLKLCLKTTRGILFFSEKLIHGTYGNYGGFSKSLNFQGKTAGPPFSGWCQGIQRMWAMCIPSRAVETCISTSWLPHLPITWGMGSSICRSTMFQGTALERCGGQFLIEVMAGHLAFATQGLCPCCSCSPPSYICPDPLGRPPQMSVKPSQGVLSRILPLLSRAICVVWNIKHQGCVSGMPVFRRKCIAKHRQSQVEAPVTCFPQRKATNHPWGLAHWEIHHGNGNILNGTCRKIDPSHGSYGIGRFLELTPLSNQHR